MSILEQVELVQNLFQVPLSKYVRSCCLRSFNRIGTLPVVFSPFCDLSQFHQWPWISPSSNRISHFPHEIVVMADIELNIDGLIQRLLEGTFLFYFFFSQNIRSNSLEYVSTCLSFDSSIVVFNAFVRPGTYHDS